MIRVYVDIVGDLFHYGHMEFLKNARAMGDYLLVGVCSDEMVAAHKRSTILNMRERIASVIGCRYVDEVVADAPWVLDRSWIEKHNIHLVVHGDDYSQEQLEDIYKVPLEMGILRTVPYTCGISTTEIIRRVAGAQGDPGPDLIQTPPPPPGRGDPQHRREAA